MPSVQKRSAFFLVVSLTMLTAVAVGFGPTFYLRTAFGAVDRFTGSASLLPHLALHGVLLTAWFLLLVFQVSLVRLGHTRLHRQLGVMGLVIAVAVVISSALTIHRVIPRVIAAAAESAAPLNAATQAAILKRGSEVVVHDFWTLVAFVVLVGVAAYLRAKPATHKRLIVLASALLIGPAFATGRPIGRALVPYLPSGILPSEVFLVLCIVALVCYDFATSRRIEPATLWGGVVAIAAVAVSTIMLLGESGAALARWIAGLSA